MCPRGQQKYVLLYPANPNWWYRQRCFLSLGPGGTVKRGGGMHSVLIGPTPRLPYACIHSGILLSHPAHLGQIVAYGTKNPDSLGQHGTARVQ